VRISYGLFYLFSYFPSHSVQKFASNFLVFKILNLCVCLYICVSLCVLDMDSLDWSRPSDLCKIQRFIFFSIFGLT
jgi:hypothetical protein